MIVEAALTLALVVVALSFLMALWRVLTGPTQTDRVLGLDTLYLNGAAVALLLGMRWGTPLLFEAALLIAMFGFIGTAAYGRYLARGEVIE